MTVTTFQRLLQARELVYQKQYHQARTLLETVDHPIAKQWLKTLDKVTTDQSPSSDNQYRASTVFIFFSISLAVIIATAALMRLAAF